MPTRWARMTTVTALSVIRPRGATVEIDGPPLSATGRAIPPATDFTLPASRFDWPRKLATKCERGLSIDVLGRAHLLDDAIVIYHHDVVRHRQRFLLVVGDEDGGDAHFALDDLEFGAHLLAQIGIECGKRLVEEAARRARSRWRSKRDALIDRQGRMLAQAVTGTPGHVNSMANAVKHFLDVYPLATMKPDDHFITNDPWLTSGHLHDITVVTPSFYRGEAVGLFANTIHVVDIGGLGMGPDGRQVYEEGLSIPIMPLAREGRMNEDLLRIVRANVREPMQVEGDIYACAASNDEGVKRLIEMMDEFEITNLDRLGDTIIEASREATLARIRALPKGTYRNRLTMDGYEKPLVLNAALTISDDGLHVDFDGTSPASSHGINVVYNYCLAYTAYGVKCLVAPDVPNNAGSLAPITVTAPEGCVLNVNRPWPVAARHTVGHMLPDAVFGCLHQAIAGGVPAEGASSLWNPQIFGGGSLVDGIGTDIDANALPAFSTVIFHCGGAGARPGKDGLSATAFPSGVRTIPVEADRERCSCCVLSPGVPRELRRRRKISRRTWSGHRVGWSRQHSHRIALQF